MTQQFNPLQQLTESQNLSSRQGWICPKCNCGVAPEQTTCPKCIPIHNVPTVFPITPLTPTSPLDLWKQEWEYPKPVLMGEAQTKQEDNKDYTNEYPF